MPGPHTSRVRRPHPKKEPAHVRSDTISRKDCQIPRNQSHLTVGTMLEPCWSRFGTTLEPCWNHVGILLEPCWNHAGTMLEPCWNHVGTMLELRWNHVGTRLESARSSRHHPPINWTQPNSTQKCWAQLIGHMVPGETTFTKWHHAKITF